MRGSDPVALRPAEPTYFGFTVTVWLEILVLSLLLAATFRYSLARLILKTNPINGEANWSHSFCVPVIGLYYLYLNREELFAARVRPLIPFRFNRVQLISSLVTLGVGGLACVGFSVRGSGQASVLFGAIALLGVLGLLFDWGLGIMLFGLFTFAYGIYPGRNDFVTDFGDVATLFGLVLMLCGWDVMQVVWFPIAFLVCAIPWPGLIYSKVASPLQRLAAYVAVLLMNATGVDSSVSGTKIFISTGIYGQPDQSLNVAEACAGLRSLMTFISIAAAVAFLSIRPFWQRVIITLSAIPIAILCNVLRVTGTGVLYRFGGPEWAEGFTHQFVGMVMLIPAFFMILMVAWILDHLFVEEVDEKGAPMRKVLRRGAAGGAPASVSVSETAPRSTSRQPDAPRRPLRRATGGGGA